MEDDCREFIDREIIDDTNIIAENQLKLCRKRQSELMGIYRELLGRKNGIGKELEIVRTEIDCAARNPFTQSLCDSVRSEVDNGIHGLRKTVLQKSK